MNQNSSAINLYYKDVGEYNLLSKEEEQQLGEDVQGGGLKASLAVNKLVTSNLRLVVKIAQDFVGRGVDLEDLVCEGNVGLHIAAKKFDPSKGARFSYYSSFWIRQNIMRAISNYGRLIRMPVNSLDKYGKILNYIKEKQEQDDKIPSKSEIAAHFGITNKRLSEIMVAKDRILPLDAQMSDDSEAKIHDVVPDETLTPYESSGKKDDHKMLSVLVDKLSERERYVIENRFGIRCEKSTLEDLGTQLNVTRERVRQIENAALSKLRVMAKGKIENEALL